MRRALPFLFVLACAGAPREAPAPTEPSPTEPSPTAPAPPAPRGVVTLSVVGTNDLHGHVEALPTFAAYVDALRAARGERGAVILLDGGDMFQGTLESNLLEGAPVVAAYEAIGYDAVTIGNHEFDYGPVGDAMTPRAPGDDRRGALLARVAEADYPFLTANLLDEATGERVQWPGVLPSVVLERAGARVGVIGVTTEDTLTTTIAGNVDDLAMAPLTTSITTEAARLRDGGADVVLVTAHAGGRCHAFDDPHDLSTCEADQEIFEVARALPRGAVDAIVAGHTHQGVAHVVNGVPIVESFSYGRAFGRVDLEVDLDAGRVTDVRVHPPRDLCASGSFDDGDCAPGEYEGVAIAPSARVAALLAPAIENAAALRAQALGVTAAAPIPREYDGESALGNLFTDLMRAARPRADVALTNGGGLRADLPAGPLTYGALHLATPFDNRFAFVRLTVADLERVIAENLRRSGGFYSISGLEAQARCVDGALEVSLSLPRARRPLPDDRELTLVTTDFLASGEGSSFASLGEDAITIEDGDTARDAMAAALRARGGTLDPRALHDPRAPRVRYEGRRPIRCREGD